MPGPRVETVGAALVALGAAEFVGLGVQQGIERVLDAIADEAVEVLVDLVLVHLDHGDDLGRLFG